MEVDASATSGSEEMVDAHEVEMGGEEVSEEEEEEFVEAEEGGGPEKEEILEGGMTEAIDRVERSSGPARKSKVYKNNETVLEDDALIGGLCRVVPNLVSNQSEQRGRRRR